MSMPRGRPSPKLAITVDAGVHEQVLAAATEEGVSVSAWMTQAARRALLLRDGLRQSRSGSRNMAASPQMSWMLLAVVSRVMSSALPRRDRRELRLRRR